MHPFVLSCMQIACHFDILSLFASLAAMQTAMPQSADCNAAHCNMFHVHSTRCFPA